MAATYPLDVVEADRWRQDRAHANLQGAQLAAAIEAEPWDPSVSKIWEKGASDYGPAVYGRWPYPDYPAPDIDTPV
jgi:hypothetical protein